MSQGRVNHIDTVVSVLIADPFQTWEDWRVVEETRQTLAVDPRDIHSGLEEVRRKFDDRVIDHMSRVGRQLLTEVAEGDFQMGTSWRLCVDRWSELPYFTRDITDTPEEVEVADLFFRYPWFFYLIITDPAL